MYHKLKAEGKQTTDMDFCSNPDQLRPHYSDMYEGAHAEMIQTNRFDENSYLGTTYLGKTWITRNITVKAEEKFPISGQVNIGKIAG